MYMNLNDKNLLRDEIAEELMRLGFSSTRVGYMYIVEAVVYVLTNEAKIVGITKTLYPHLAKIFGTSAQAVERAMRMAIADVCKIGNDSIRRLAGLQANCRLHFTNKEFIYKTVNYVKKQLEISNN